MLADVRAVCLMMSMLCDYNFSCCVLDDVREVCLLICAVVSLEIPCC